MEVGESGSRHSGTASNPVRYDQHHHQHQQQLHYPSQQYRDVQDRYGERPTMATAALMTPNTPYLGHLPSYSPGYAQPAPATSIAGMISPVDPRRPSDDSEVSQRQSLPSISEVISVAKQTAYPPPTTMPGSSFPPPFASTSAPPRPPYADEKSSPRLIHPSSAYPPRHEPLPTFAEAPRAPFVTRAAQPLNTFPGPHPSPPIKPDHEEKVVESHQVNGAYSHAPPQPHAYAPGQLPSGQHPLPGYPVSPRHPGPSVPMSYESQRPPVHLESAEYGPPRQRYETTLTRHFEAWGYQESLSRIASSSRTIYNFAEAYGKIAQEQHGAQPIPERLPSEREVADMLACADYIKKSLESLRDVVLTNMQERARESKAKGTYEDEDVPMYDGMKPQYSGITEVKKRRGRAAPPGRCHSCNRQDTPEWRRGPDGARTLCNACGLHYAKLERKRQLEARSIRPKPSEERN